MDDRIRQKMKRNSSTVVPSIQQLSQQIIHSLVGAGTKRKLPTRRKAGDGASSSRIRRLRQRHCTTVRGSGRLFGLILLTWWVLSILLLHRHQQQQQQQQPQPQQEAQQRQSQLQSGEPNHDNGDVLADNDQLDVLKDQETAVDNQRRQAQVHEPMDKKALAKTTNALRATPTTVASSSSSSSPRTMILLIASNDHELNRQRIAEMRRFYKNNFMVVWDHAESPECPFRDNDDMIMKKDGSLLCLDEYQISQSRRLSHMCCGQEKAVMWAMQNRHLFDYVWFMEEDVYATDIYQLDQVLSLNTSSSHVDLLHQWRGHLSAMGDQWFYAHDVVRDAKGLFQASEMKQGLFNLFRMSTNLLAALEEVYLHLGQEWFFFEVLVPTVVATSTNLTQASWKLQLLQDDNHSKNSTIVMKVQPQCMTHFEKPGIYHPVKYHNGSFVSCPPLQQHAPSVKEGFPYKNQVSRLQSAPSSASSDMNQEQPHATLIHACIGPLGGGADSTNWNAIAGWVKYHEKRWGLTHADIFVRDDGKFDHARHSFAAVGLDSTVTLNFTLYPSSSSTLASSSRSRSSSSTTTTTSSSSSSTNGEAWLAKECRTNAIAGNRDFLMEFEPDRFLVSDSFDSLHDMFDYTDYPDAVVFPTFSNNYGVCSSNSMTFASAIFVDHLFPDFAQPPRLCPRTTPTCKMSDGIYRHFMIPAGTDPANSDNEHHKGTHLIRFANRNENDVGLHEDLTTKACQAVKDCKYILEHGECTDWSEIAGFEQQVTSINTILSDLDLTFSIQELKQNAICYAQRYPDLLRGYCHDDISKCHFDGLHYHYVKYGSKSDLIWQCERKFSPATPVTPRLRVVG